MYTIKLFRRSAWSLSLEERSYVSIYFFRALWSVPLLNTLAQTERLIVISFLLYVLFQFTIADGNKWLV